MPFRLFFPLEPQSPPPFCGVMATLMEFAAASLERDGGSRALDGSVPPAVVTPPVLHWGSAGRRALDADGKRCVKVAARAPRCRSLRAARAPPPRGGAGYERLGLHLRALTSRFPSGMSSSW